MGKEPSPFSCVWLPEIWCSKLSFLRAEQGAHPGLTHLPSSARRALTAKTRDEKFSSDCRPLELNLNTGREARRPVARWRIHRVCIVGVWSLVADHIF